jgi:hypothetical protein
MTDDGKKYKKYIRFNNNDLSKLFYKLPNEDKA